MGFITVPSHPEADISKKHNSHGPLSVCRQQIMFVKTDKHSTRQRQWRAHRPGEESHKDTLPAAHDLSAAA